MHSMKETD